MKCFNCRKEMNGQDDKLGYLQCLCGVKYSMVIIKEYKADKVKKKEYDRIRRWRLFEIQKTDNGLILICHCVNKKVVHPLYYKVHQFLKRKGWIKDEFYR